MCWVNGQRERKKEGRKYCLVGATAVVICRREKGGEAIIGEGSRGDDKAEERKMMC